MLSTINPNLLIATADSVTGLTTAQILPDTTEPASLPAESPASIVELSAQAQSLLETAATAALDNEIQDAQAFQVNEQQLANLAVAAQATLTQDIEAAQKTALTETEANVIDQALQSTIADAALSEAIAATAASTSAATETATTTAAAATLATPVAPTVTTTATTPVVTTPTPVVAGIIEIQPNVIPASVIAGEINPDIPITDPSIAAAIAAYHVGDNMFTEEQTLAEEAAPETDIDVAPTLEIEGTKVDLHDSPRDDALTGATWNWLRINPIIRRLAKR